MKYMGSKRLMLKNGLGHVLEKEVIGTKRFIDIFSGSGVVATHIAENYDIEVNAYDLQLYSSVITGSIIKRDNIIEWQPMWDGWYKEAEDLFKNYRIPSTIKITQPIIKSCRAWCAKQKNLPITQAYGGHYFSPKQAVWIDSLRTTLPSQNTLRTVALAALIQAASKCVAAPGHTAQPFQPTRSAKPHLVYAWEKDVVNLTKNSLLSISNRFAKKKGFTKVIDANKIADEFKQNDLVFIDPPYSGVHYSRFYHVLETIARGECGVVTGVGRYPEAKLRPRSNYSMRSKSLKALDELLNKIANKGAKAIITFPDHECSNGLSGNSVRETTQKYFSVEEHSVESKLSSLGGKSNGDKKQAGRDARLKTNELILVLKPKRN